MLVKTTWVQRQAHALRNDHISLLQAIEPLVFHHHCALPLAKRACVISWEFKPATRNGAPIDVEVVIEIPFNAPSGQQHACLTLARRPLPWLFV